MNTVEKLRKIFKETEEDNTVSHSKCSYRVSYWASRRELQGYLKALDDVEKEMWKLTEAIDGNPDEQGYFFHDMQEKIKELRG